MASASARSKKEARWGLKWKLILSMLLVGLVPLLIGLVMAFYLGFQEIQQVSGSSFKAIATESARKLDLVLSEEMARTARIASEPLIVSALEKRRDIERSEEDRNLVMTQTAKAWETQDPQLVKAFTQGPVADLLRRYYTGTLDDPGETIPVVRRAAKRALYVTDIYGALVASINTEASYLNAEQNWWRGAFNKGVGKAFIENVTFDERFGVYTFTLSLPIMDSIRYQAIGVLHQVYDAKEFLAPSVHPIHFGETGHVMLIDSRGTVITCPRLPTGDRLSDAELVSLVTPIQPGWVLAHSDGHGDQSSSIIGSIAGSIIGFAPLPETSQVTQESSNQAWHTFAWQSSDELFAPVQHLLTWISVFGLLAAGLLGTLGFMAAGRIVTPIRRLQEAALLIGRGELKEPITIKTGDEIEDLADEINRMNAQLEVAFAGLTHQVAQKTQEVQYLQQTTDQILDSMTTPIFLLDPDAHVQYINRAAKDAFSLGEADGQSACLYDLLHLDEAGRTMLSVELQNLTAESDVTASGSNSPPAGTEVRDPLDPRRKPRPTSHRKELHLGPRIFQYEWFQISGRSGDAKRIGLILRDATEDSRKQDQLIQAEKLGSVSVLAAGIGHELNNPLFGILGLGEAIQDETDLGKIKAHARDIVENGKRMAVTIRDFTGLVRADAKSRTVPVDLNEQLDQALKLIPGAGESDGLEIRTDYQPLRPITAAPEELRLVFVNVIANAVQAMKYEGTLSLSTQMSNGTIQVRIQDTGPGIPKDYLSKVFDPFFTTKGQGEGSGLGLTVANRIITKHGGRMQVESEEGKGTTCVIAFPVPDTSTQGESRQ